ncbi:hypothetical protein H0H87_003207 [Tephrocybe sp. NHM501043]|nr:hypothetical protein H0H87_003207 [Tephrocybe sp. NHM501043]
MVQQYSTPVGRSRHGKRLPQVPDNSESDQPAPSAVVTPTVTVLGNPSSSVQPIPATPVDPTQVSPVVVTPTDTPASSGGGYYGSSGYEAGATQDGVGTTKASAEAQSSQPTPNSKSSSGTPVGAIVGIVLAVVLLVAAGAVFWFRRRAVANRLKTRQWTKQQNAPSFLWVEPKHSAHNITPFPVMGSNTLQPHRGRDIEANMMFGGPGGAPPASNGIPVNNDLPYIPPPAPPRPPKAAGIYDLTSAPTTPATALSASDAVRPLPKLPVSANIPSSPATNKQPESAKVRSTFIPTLPDELTIKTGEMVRIHEEYDDGWALCSNARGEMGMAPLECLDKASEQPRPTNREFKKLARVSSLAATPKSAYSGFQSIALQIFSYLEYETLTVCSLVSRRWHSLANDQSHWMRLCQARNWKWRQLSRIHPLNTPLTRHDGVNDSDDEGMGASDEDSDNGDSDLIMNDIEATKAELTIIAAELDSGIASTSFTSPPLLDPEPSTSGIRYTVYPKGSPSRSRTRPHARHSAPPVLKTAMAVSSHLTPDYKLLYRTHMKLHHRFLKSSYRLSALQTRGTPDNAHTNTIYCLQLYTYSSGLQVLFTGSRDRTVREWNMTTGHIERVITGVHTASILSLCAHGGYLASAGSDNRVVVWDLEKNKIHKILMDHTNSVLCVRFDDERLVSCSKDHTVRVYSFPELAPQFILQAHRAAVNAVSISQNLIASGSGDKSVKLWDANTDKHMRLINVASVNQGWSTSLDYLYNPPELASCALSLTDNGLHPVCQFCGSENIRLVPSTVQGPCVHADLVRSVVLGEDFVVSGSYDLSIKIWDRKTGAMIADLTGGHTARIFCIAFDRSKIVSCGEDQRICIWDFSHGIDTSFLHLS